MKNKFLLGVVSLFVLVALPVFASDPSSFGPGDGPYNDDIVLSQEITDEISFSLEDTVLSMGASIPGLTGATRTADTDFAVMTNNATGYKVELSMANDGKMVGPTINSVGYFIPAYPGTQGAAWSLSAGQAGFGYATSGADVWFAGTGSNVIIKTFAYPTAWATTTLNFKVQIMPNPTTMIAEGFYYATTTLTATML